MRTTPCLALALLLLECGCAETPRVRNAVLICLDTVRYDTLALLHQVERGDDASRWWERGTRLVRTQSTAPWTLPAVASVFTGLYPNQHRAGVLPGRVADITKEAPEPLPEGLPTLAEALSEAGFETAGFVAHNWFAWVFGLQRGFASLDLDLFFASDVIARSDAWLEARARRSEARPFFLYLHFFEAHAPWRPGEYRLGSRVVRLSPALRERAIAANPAVCAELSGDRCRDYLGYVEAVLSLRGAVALVLESLEARGLLASTVVVVFSDHGEEFLDHAREEAERKLDPRGFHGVGHGHTLYQEQLHVPLVLWHPELAPGELAIPASLVDVAPTLLGWLGVAPGWRFAGVDLGPALGGAPIDPERSLFSSSVALGPEREAVVRGAHKRISDDGSGALSFDLTRDPGERTPTSDAALASLDALLADYRAAKGPSGEPAQPTREDLERLQALGYLGDVRVE